jgi:hypothetical protein
VAPARRFRENTLVFELWDAELGVSLGTFASETEALTAVRRLCEQSQGSRAPLGLVAEQRPLSRQVMHSSSVR